MRSVVPEYISPLSSDAELDPGSNPESSKSTTDDRYVPISLGVIITHQVQGVNAVSVIYVNHTLKYSGLLQIKLSNFQADIGQEGKLTHILAC